MNSISGETDVKVDNEDSPSPDISQNGAVPVVKDKSSDSGQGGRHDATEEESAPEELEDKNQTTFHKISNLQKGAENGGNKGDASHLGRATQITSESPSLTPDDTPSIQVYSRIASRTRPELTSEGIHFILSR